MASFVFVLGTRPEIIKLAPLIRRCADRGIDFSIIHTGQHYDDKLDGIFFRELDIPEPTRNLKAAGGSQKEFFAKVFPELEAAFTKENPKVVIVQGDTNSAYAGACVAHALEVPLAHVEAGLRSDDLTMPEEVNRIAIDGLAQRLYVPTEAQRRRLLAEGITADCIVLTGNTVADAVSEHLAAAHKTEVPLTLPTEYAVLTLHRPALVDEPKKLTEVLTVIAEALTKRGLVGIFPVHPRTRPKLAGWSHASVQIVDPIGYLVMLKVLSDASLVITDSGGIQEEAAILKVPCVTVRENTERPETIEAGGNMLVGFDTHRITTAIVHWSMGPFSWKPLYAIEQPSDVMLDDLTSRYA